MVYLSTKTKITAIITLVCLAILILVLNPSFQSSFEGRGKIYPGKVFFIRTNTSGGIESFLTDNLKGRVEKYSMFNFDRNDVINFELFQKDRFVEKKDTIAVLSSNIYLERIEEIKLKLAEFEGELEVLSSGERNELIDEMKLRVDYAEKQLEIQQKIYERSKKLLSRNIISQEEFDITEGKLDLNRIEVNIAAQMLKAAKAGSKKEEINSIRKQINAAENLIAMLENKSQQLKITAPFDGEIQSYENNDTLLTVKSVNNKILILPIPANRMNQIEIGSSVFLETTEVESQLKIKTIDDNIFYYNREPYFKVISEPFDIDHKLPPNGVVSCFVDLGKIDLRTYLLKLMN